MSRRIGPVQRIDAVFDAIDKISAVISSVLLIAVTLLITAGTINRAFIGMIWVFVEEWSALALIPMSYLVMGYTMRWNRHMKVDLAVKKLPPRWRRICGVFAAFFSLVCLGFMVERSWDWFIYTVREQVTSSGPMRTPLWIFSASVVFGLLLFMVDMLLLLAHELFRLLRDGSTLRFQDDEEPAANESATPEGAPR